MRTDYGLEEGMATTMAAVFGIAVVVGLVIWAIVAMRAEEAAFERYVVEHHCELKDTKTGACYYIGDTMLCDSHTRAYLCDGGTVIVR